MTKVVLFLCGLLTGIVSVQAQYTLDDVLLEFRKDYVDYKTKSIRNLDEAYFKVYTGLKKTLDRIFLPYFSYNAAWDSICSNISKTLTKSSASRLKNVCRVINSTINLVTPTINGEMISFHSGLVGSPTEFEELAIEVFLDVEDNMNTIPPIYIADPVCIKPMLKTYPLAYTPAIDAIQGIGKNCSDNINYFFDNATKASKKAATALNTLTLSYNKCMNGKEPSDCVKDLMKQQNDCDDCENLYEILMAPIQLVQSCMSVFNEFLSLQIRTAARVGEKADDNLEAWIEKAENCRSQAENVTKGEAVRPPRKIIQQFKLE